MKVEVDLEHSTFIALFSCEEFYVSTIFHMAFSCHHHLPKIIFFPSRLFLFFISSLSSSNMVHKASLQFLSILLVLPFVLSSSAVPTTSKSEINDEFFLDYRILIIFSWLLNFLVLFSWLLNFILFGETSVRKRRIINRNYTRSGNFSLNPYGFN